MVPVIGERWSRLAAEIVPKAGTCAFAEAIRQEMCLFVIANAIGRRVWQRVVSINISVPHTQSRGKNFVRINRPVSEKLQPLSVSTTPQVSVSRSAPPAQFTNRGRGALILGCCRASQRDLAAGASAVRSAGWHSAAIC